MSMYQMAIAFFLENKKTKKREYKFYDYFSTKQGIHKTDLNPKDGFEIVDIKIATGRNSVSQLLNECIMFKDKNK